MNFPCSLLVIRYTKLVKNFFFFFEHLFFFLAEKHVVDSSRPSMFGPACVFGCCVCIYCP